MSWQNLAYARGVRTAVILFSGNSGYYLGCTIGAVSAQRLEERVKNYYKILRLSRRPRVYMKYYVVTSI